MQQSTIVPLPGRILSIETPQEAVTCSECGSIFNPYARAAILRGQGKDLVTRGVDCPSCHFPFATVQEWVIADPVKPSATLEYKNLFKEIPFK